MPRIFIVARNFREDYLAKRLQIVVLMTGDFLSDFDGVIFRLSVGVTTFAVPFMGQLHE